ncbi:D-alanine--D-alanine ligase [Candidatus Kuenenbacteria bacterium]|nr:D-alanine--D-alanine ligase [Candidatus Kuenenbacteria bacterium]
MKINKINKKIKVGVVFGGKSPEHEVSIVSARGIIENIDKAIFGVVEIFIDKKGLFWFGNGKNKKRFDPFKNSKDIDVFFPIIHGQSGEDGEIQGLFRTINKPFVGADILASSICLDKGIFKLILKAEGLSQVEFEILDYKKMPEKQIASLISKTRKEFSFPVFVKPCNSGSSVGIYKVKNKKDLSKYINLSRKFDFRIVVEESVELAREIEVAVIGNNYSNIEASLPGEIIAGAEFYDYNDKYKDGKAETVAPANISSAQRVQIQKLAVEVYSLTCCEGLARVDFFIDKKGKIFINEINTLPGFTPISMYPKMWQASGLNYKSLITKLIMLALKKK